LQQVNTGNWTFVELGKTNPIQTQSKPKQSQFKPNCRKAKKWCKVCIYKGLWRKMRIWAMKKQSQTNPIQTQSSLSSNVVVGCQVWLRISLWENP